MMLSKILCNAFLIASCFKSILCHTHHSKSEERTEGGTRQLSNAETTILASETSNYILTFDSPESQQDFIENSPVGIDKYAFKYANLVAVTLTDDEAQALEASEVVLRMSLDEIITLPEISLAADHNITTNSWTLGDSVPYGIKMVNAFEVDDSKVSNVTVCIADTGYDLGHVDLQTTNVIGASFVSSNTPWYQDVSGHGTHVAGTIAALGNGYGVVGVVRSGKMNLLIAKVLGDDGRGSTSAVLKGFDWCAKNGADIISASLVHSFYVNQYNNYANALYNSGVLVVASAGNAGPNAMNYPGIYDGVMSVGAIDRNENVASFSNTNDYVEIAAPGVSVLSTFPNNKYVYRSGTSMACPHVAAVAALLKSHFPGLSASDLRTALQLSAKDLGDNGRDDKYGFGLVDAKAAYDLISSTGKDFTASPTASPTECAGRMIHVVVRIDDNGAETSWELKNQDNQVILSGGPYNKGGTYTLYIHDICVEEPECMSLEIPFKFALYDSSGNGMNGIGIGHRVYVDGIVVSESTGFDGYSFIDTFNFCEGATVHPSSYPSSHPTVPSYIPPTMEPSPSPVLIICSKTQQKHFIMTLTPERRNSKDIYMIVQTRSTKGKDSDFNDSNFVLRKKRFSKEANQIVSKCISKRRCYRAVVYSKSGDGIGKGSFDAYWDDNQISFSAFTPITSGKLAGQSKSVSQTFGKCS